MSKRVWLRCNNCDGKGSWEYCVNPDNGFLDTLSHMLEYKNVTCKECNGTGYIEEVKENSNG